MRSNFASAMIAGLALSGMVGPSDDFVRLGEPEVDRRPRQPSAKPATPTAADHERLRLAQAKRERRAARQAKGMQA